MKKLFVAFLLCFCMIVPELYADWNQAFFIRGDRRIDTFGDIMIVYCVGNFLECAEIYVNDETGEWKVKLGDDEFYCKNEPAIVFDEENNQHIITFKPEP